MYCPSCKSEFRPGIEHCAKCEVALVDTLAKDDRIATEEEADTVSLRAPGVGGMARFPLGQAEELAGLLSESGVPCLLAPAAADEHLDQQARFEIRVRARDEIRAMQALQAVWEARLAREGVGAVTETALDQCPACGAKVPLAAEECPDCGLFVGAAEGEAEA